MLDKFFPMEILNFIRPEETGNRPPAPSEAGEAPGRDRPLFDRVVTVYTVPSSLHCAREAVYLGDDFMDRYEAPEIHRQNEQI